MKLPRDVSGRQLAKLLGSLGQYKGVRKAFLIVRNIF